MLDPTTAPVIMFGFKLFVIPAIENINEVTNIAIVSESATPFIIIY